MMVYPECHSNLTHRSWARVTWRPRLPQICLLFRCPVSPWSNYYSLSWASVRKQVKLYESLSFTIVCEHRFLDSETSIWSSLTASKAVNYHFHHVTKTNPATDFRIGVVSCHELIGQLSLIPLMCLYSIPSRSDGHRPSTRHLKTPLAIHMLPLCVAHFLPSLIIALWAELLLGKQLSSTSHGSLQSFLFESRSEFTTSSKLST